jgi:hypothetical protein
VLILIWTQNGNNLNWPSLKKIDKTTRFYWSSHWFKRWYYQVLTEDIFESVIFTNNFYFIDDFISEKQDWFALFWKINIDLIGNVDCCMQYHNDPRMTWNNVHCCNLSLCLLVLSLLIIYELICIFDVKNKLSWTYLITWF